MSDFETITQLQGGLPGTAPKILSASTADEMATVIATGYLTDIGTPYALNNEDIFFIRIADGDPTNDAVFPGYVSVTGSAPNLVYSWVQGLPNSGGGGGAVTSVFGRTGSVVAAANDYNVSQVIGAAPLASPTFTGTPSAPTPTAGTSTTQIATTAFVATSYAPLISPAFSGIPTAPTASPGTSTTQIATTAFVAAAVSSAPVTSVFGRTGAVVAVNGDYTVNEVTGAAPLASPTFTGTPAAPTASVGTSTTQIATTAFVAASVGSYAPLASPAFTGTPTAPTAAAGTASTQLATTAFVSTSFAPLASPSFTGSAAFAGSITAGGRIGTTSGGIGIVGDSQITGNLTLSAAGNKLLIATGANASVGNVTLDTGTAVVSTTAVTANSIILLTTQVLGGTIGTQYISARTAGTSFTITSSSNADASTVGWAIIN